MVRDQEDRKIAEEEDTFSVEAAEADDLYTFAEETIKMYKHLGLIGRPRPRLSEAHSQILEGLQAGDFYDGRLPVTIKQLSLDELSSMYSLSSSWYAYLGSQFALISTRRNEARKKKEVLWSILRNSYRKIGRRYGIKYSDQKLSDFARQDRRFVEADSAYESLNTAYSTILSFLEVTKSEMEVISREVTIRQVKLESSYRSGKFMSDAVGMPEKREELSDTQKPRSRKPRPRAAKTSAPKQKPRISPGSRKGIRIARRSD